MIMRPQNDCPEGDLLAYMFKMFKQQGASGASGNFTNNQINEMITRVDAIAGKQDDSVYNKIVEYVNTNYGIVSVREHKQYEKLLKDLEKEKKDFSVAEVYDRLKGIPEPESDTMLRVAEDENDPVPYIDT